MTDWNPYFEHIIANRSVVHIGIYDMQGIPWAYSSGFTARITEIAEINTHRSNPSKLAAMGINIAGGHYDFKSGEPNQEIYCTRGRQGMFFSYSNTYVVVGYHDELIRDATCRSAVNKISFYLRQREEEARSSSRGQNFWQPYVNHAVSSWMVVTGGGMYDMQGNCWAHSKGFLASQKEISTVASHFSAPHQIEGKQITLAGEQYNCVAGEANKEIYLKIGSAPYSMEQGDAGIVFRKCGNKITGNFLVVGQHNNRIPPAACRLALAKVAEWFDQQAAEC